MFKADNLSVLLYANNFTLWSYTTTDIFETIDVPEYFGDAVDMFRINDMIIIHADIGAVVLETRQYIIIINDGVNVGIKQLGATP